MKRLFDVALAAVLLLVFSLPLLVIALLVKLSSRGPVLYCSDRVGRRNRLFRMPKFRTMVVGTPAVATHLLINADSHITPLGGLLRRTSLDELPQLWSILVGDMSFVGPRPALFNQHDLVELRTRLGIDRLTPGLTGWAQVNGRDELSIAEKVRHDEYYLRHRSLQMDVKIVLLTLLKAVRGDGVVQTGSQPAARKRAA